MYRPKILGLGLLALLAVGAMASAPASASGPYLYTAGSSEPLMGALELTATQSGTSELKATIAGVAVTIVCEEGHSESMVAENVLTPGIEHTIGLSISHSLKCGVAKPSGKKCLVENGLTLWHDDILTLTTGGVPRVRYFPLSSIPISVSIDSCSIPALNGTFPVTGFIQAIPNNTTSTLEFTESSGSELTVAGNAATFIGNFAIEMRGGGALEFK
jgi:hypothetical protein